MDALTEFHIVEHMELCEARMPCGGEMHECYLDAGHSGECECGVCETLAADEKEGA